MPEQLQLVECPRDAMQGLHKQVPTAKKISYLNQLLKVGFHTLDFGSFVSPKAVPQMADTAEVVEKLDLSETDTQLLAIVANQRGAEAAVAYDQITYLGYPFSISETFQQRNTRRSISESIPLVKDILALCEKHGKELVLYISMGFGNPYGENWSPEIVEEWAEKMISWGVKIISLADTVGNAQEEDIRLLFKTLLSTHPGIEWGAHFHATPSERIMKLTAAWEEGCRRFDSAMLGFGGCPFADDELVGNIATESLIPFLEERKANTALNKEAFQKAMHMANDIFL
ncbi:MAG: hydroxymethylglutaryl-CoA lyase [Bacteroidota bacterium]